MSQADLERFAKWADVTPEQFTLMYCRWIESDDGFEYLSLREKKNMECIFWNDGCEAYQARPVQCRTYPFWTKVLENQDNLTIKQAEVTELLTVEDIAHLNLLTNFHRADNQPS